MPHVQAASRAATRPSSPADRRSASSTRTMSGGGAMDLRAALARGDAERKGSQPAPGCRRP
eukprot:15440898-Alexandrium_andersonii.AAC.1